MIDAGVEETQVNTILSALNVAPISNATLKRYETVVGAGTEKVAAQSCSEALELEIALTKEANAVVEDK